MDEFNNSNKQNADRQRANEAEAERVKDRAYKAPYKEQGEVNAEEANKVEQARKAAEQSRKDQQVKR